MIDLSKLRQYAQESLNDARDAASMERAANIVKLVEEIENQRANARKTLSERQDILLRRRDVNRTRWKDFLAALTPLLTTLILAGTLIFQGYTFRKSEEDKILEAQRQAELAEKTRWTDALKLLVQSEKLSPASALLRSFTTAPYKQYSRDTTMALLLQRTSSPDGFEELFRSTLEPVDWESLGDTLQLNRRLFAQLNPLLVKEWGPGSVTANSTKLSKEEKLRLDSLESELGIVSSAILPVLKSTRPKDLVPDLKSVYFYDCDLSNTDFNGLDIQSSDFSYDTFDNADLSGITSFSYSVFEGSPWWHAKRISPELLQYLRDKYAFDPHRTEYRGTNDRLTREDYVASLARLTGQNPTASPHEP